MRIVISIVYTESWQPMADIVLPVTQKYCERHGYELVATCFPEPCSSKFGWNKISQAKRLISEGFDAIMAMDLDAMITNFTTKIEDFIDDEYELLICRDYNGINAGVFIINDWNDILLHKLELIGQENNFDCEQNAIEKYIADGEDEHIGKVKILPHPSINSYDYNRYPDIPPQTEEHGQWQPGNFIIHFPGISVPKRIELLKEYKTKIIYE